MLFSTNTPVILLFYVNVLLIVAFFTLFERKLMASFHIRKGPNKNSFIGIIQPLLDALKLLTKQRYYPIYSNKFIYNLAPRLVLVISVFIWQFLPFSINNINHSINMIWYLVFMRVIVFFNIMRGWSRNNKYSLIGILRSAATTIRYEASFMFCILFLCVIFYTFNISRFYYHGDYFMLIILPFIFISIIAELHRAPFDFRESERELVRGYNTEYRGKHFAYLFLGEYSILLFNSIFMSIVFVGIDNIIVLRFSTILFTVLFTNVRVSVCRYRYDLLIMFNWKLLLPIIIILVIILIVI
jgi:NADH:ubiquinone oxidoreductase subunit H